MKYGVDAGLARPWEWYNKNTDIKEPNRKILKKKKERKKERKRAKNKRGVRSKQNVVDS